MEKLHPPRFLVIGTGGIFAALRDIRLATKTIDSYSEMFAFYAQISS